MDIGRVQHGLLDIRGQHDKNYLSNSPDHVEGKYVNGDLGTLR